MPTFNPPDHELIEVFLNKMITGNYDIAAWNEINVLNVCHHKPEDFPGLVSIKSSHTWYFISPVEKLKGKRGRTKRSSETGHWAITGKDCNVKDVYGNIIGFKKYLVFQESKNKKNKSPWTIHEFHSNIKPPNNKDDFVLCKLIKKTRTPRNDAVDVTDDSSEAVATDPTINHFQTQNDNNIAVEDYDLNFVDNVEIYFPQLQSMDLLDQPQYPNDSLNQFKDNYFADPIIQSMEQGESSRLSFDDTGYVYGQFQEFGTIPWDL